MPNISSLILLMLLLTGDVWAQELGRNFYICPDPPESHIVATRKLPSVHKCKPLADGKDFHFCPGPPPNFTKYTSNVWLADIWNCEPAPFPVASSKGIHTAEFARSAPSQSEERSSLADIVATAAQRGLGLALIMLMIVAVPVAVIFSRRLWGERLGAVSNEAFEAAAAELDSDAKDKGLWARLYAKHGGNESKTRANYIRERAATLSKYSSLRSATLDVSKMELLETPQISADDAPKTATQAENSKKQVKVHEPPPTMLEMQSESDSPPAALYIGGIAVILILMLSFLKFL